MPDNVYQKLCSCDYFISQGNILFSSLEQREDRFSWRVKIGFQCFLRSGLFDLPPPNVAIRRSPMAPSQVHPPILVPWIHEPAKTCVVLAGNFCLIIRYPIHSLLQYFCLEDPMDRGEVVWLIEDSQKIPWREMMYRTLNSLPCGFLFSRKLVPSRPNFLLLLNSHFCFLSLVRQI